MRKTILRNGLLFVLLPLLCLLLACADDNTEIPAAKVHPLAWSEPTNFTNADFHGKVVVVEGNDACQQCHGLDLAGSGDVPSCTYCHDDIEGGHLPGNELPEIHGVRALDDFQICKLCHGDDYLGGIVGVSCADCHTIPWPHPANSIWLDNSDPGFHGVEADTALAREDCKRCHGADLRGGSTLVSCFTCHFDETGSESPPGVNFTFSSGNHNDNNLHESLRAFVSTCNNCHNTNRAYGNLPGNCHDCHGDGD